MRRREISGLAFAAAIFSQAHAFGEGDRFAAVIFAGEAQASEGQEQQTSPAQEGQQPAPASGTAQPQTPPASAPKTVAPQTPQPPVQLPPVKIIQTPPAPAKPAKKNNAAAKVSGPANAVHPAHRTAAPSPPQAAPPLEVPGEAEGQTVAMTPVKGSEIPLANVPGGIAQLSSTEIEQNGSPAIEDVLQQGVPGVVVSDVSGNPFATDVQYRGFTASPVEGTPQGLAVYQNGVRINEVFGDTVNWVLIPPAAIKTITVVSGNPLYGLNALGGAINIGMKDGFGFQGVESDSRAGSYGRLQESLQMGKVSGDFAVYAAIEGIHDDGWREFSPSELRRSYFDLGVKSTDTEFHINFTGAESALGVAGPTPVQLLAQDYAAVFTNPQTTDNQLAMLSANGSVKLSDTLSLSGVGYLRSFHQSHTDGNVSSVAPCNLLNGGTGYDPGGLLCLQTSAGQIVPVTDQFGHTITTGTYYAPNATIGEIDYTTNNANSFGLSLQATDKDKILEHDNILIAGVSADLGSVKSTSNAELGTLNTSNFVVAGNGIYLASPLDIAPIDLKTSTSYYSFFFSDTLDVTRALSVTAGGRYNYEELLLDDLTGGTLSGDHLYTRFNPMAGLTYKFNSNVSGYGGYAEANRAPTPAELSCADPAQPCLLQNFLVTDPNLKQVVSKTWQGGFRGNFSPFGYGNLNWTAGAFRTENFNDILNVTDPVIRTRGYFANDGDTLRQGIEASIKYQREGISLNANYAYVDAIFLSNLTIPSPNNPFAGAGGNIFVHPGDHIPTIPAHRFKAGVDYEMTDAWKIGADAVLASGQYFFGDESNQNPKLPGYSVFNLRTSYEISHGVTFYGLINNLFDRKYATYGAFYNTNIADVSGNASTNLTNPAMITPAQPLSVYGGIKLKF